MLSTKKLGKRAFVVQILFTVILALCFGEGYEQFRHTQRWSAYNQTYGKQLLLPTHLNVPHATLGFLPGLAKDSLTVRIYKPDTEDDEELRTWIASHNRCSAFQPSYKRLSGPQGQWEATRGRETIQFYRLDDYGWITISVFERITEKDYAEWRKLPTGKLIPKSQP